jgi:hypothetical protein
MRLELSASPRLAAAIVGLHAAAGLSLITVVPGPPGQLLCLAFLALGSVAAWRQAFLRSPGSIRALEIGGSAVTLDLANGARLVGEIEARRYVGRFMVVLFVRRPIRRTILVTGDMLGTDSFRTLRIWALWGRFSSIGQEQPVAGKPLAV